MFWCAKRDLNPYGVNHTPLKRARLPVPPLALTGAIIAQSWSFVKGGRGFFSEFFCFFAKRWNYGEKAGVRLRRQGTDVHAELAHGSQKMKKWVGISTRGIEKADSSFFLKRRKAKFTQS